MQIYEAIGQLPRWMVVVLIDQLEADYIIEARGTGVQKTALT